MRPHLIGRGRSEPNGRGSVDDDGKVVSECVAAAKQEAATGALDHWTTIYHDQAPLDPPDSCAITKIIIMGDVIVLVDVVVVVVVVFARSAGHKVFKRQNWPQFGRLR